MAYVRLYLFPDRFITLTYGLPLLLCLWHRDRKLLWAMTGVFIAMSAYKALYLLAPRDLWTTLHWQMQVVNTVVVALAVDMIVRLLGRLEIQNQQLQQTNDELAARDEEISHQNEELQAQAEEMAQQNEELQQQSEELQQQAEELQAQSEELHATNDELTQREKMLQTLLQSLRVTTSDDSVLQDICRCALELLGGSGSAAAVVQALDEQVAVTASIGSIGRSQRLLPLNGSFAGIVMRQNRTAFVEDLDARRDLAVLASDGSFPFRSVLSSPVRLDDEPVGAVEVYSNRPRLWTTADFRIIEWVAAQCSLILEVRRLHEALAETNNNLERLVEDRTAQLREMVDELEHFSYSITHDMRAPLRAMQGFCELLVANQLDEASRRDFLNRIITAAGRMDRLITDALSYSRSVRQELPLRPVDTRKLLKGMIESYPEFQPPGARIEVADDLPTVFANEAGLTQCFSNLLNNAVKFVEQRQQPHVRVRGEYLDGVARIWFEDNGIGIPRELAPRMFGMFQRGSRQYEGNGIGLALVRKVTERMGGKVGVESEPGKGSRFWVELKACNEIVDSR